MDLTDNVGETLLKTTNLYTVEIEFLDSVLGGNPKNPEVFRTHIESSLRREAKRANKLGLEPPTEERIQEIVGRRMKEMFGADVEATIDAETEKTRTIFKINKAGPYIEPRQVKAMIREMASTQGLFVQHRGLKQTFQHLIGVVAADEDGNPLDGPAGQQINFYRDGEVITEADDYVEMCAHVMGPQGPRSCIKQHERIVGATIRFCIRAPANLPKNRATATFKDEEVVKILTHGQEDGLGACRSQGHGKFWIVRLERLTNIPWVKGGKAPGLKKKIENGSVENEPDNGATGVAYA